MTKKCCRCKLIKPHSEFYKNRRKRDGLQSQCRECKRKIDHDAYHGRTPQLKQQILNGRKRSKKRDRQYVQSYLLEHPCIDCGNRDTRVLEFDHVRGKKYKEIVVMINGGYGIKTIDAEIKKCEVRCANCHRIKHKRAAGEMVSLGPLKA